MIGSTNVRQHCIQQYISHFTFVLSNIYLNITQNIIVLRNISVYITQIKKERRNIRAYISPFLQEQVIYRTFLFESLLFQQIFELQQLVPILGGGDEVQIFGCRHHLGASICDCLFQLILERVSAIAFSNCGRFM